MKLYDKNLFLLYSLEDLFGSMMTYLEEDVLPFPHIKGIDLGPAMKRRVFDLRQIKTAQLFFLIRISPRNESFNMRMSFLFH